MTTTSAKSQIQPKFIIKKRWQLLIRIGRGTFGQVYKCKNLHTRKIVAVKLEEIHKQSKQVSSLLYEAKIYRYLKEKTGA